MAVNVNGGPLEFDLLVNMDPFVNGIKSGIQQGVTEANKLETALRAAANNGAEGFVKVLHDATNSLSQIMPLIQKGISGIDPSKLQELNDQLGLTNSEFEMIHKLIPFIQENLNNFKLNPEEIAQLGAGVERIKTAFDGVNEKQVSVITQFRTLKDQLTNQASSGSLFGDTLQQATDLQERMKNVREELKLAGSNAPGLVATSQALRGLVGGFQALQGAMALFSGSNEDVARTTESLVASMSILQGIQEVMQVIDRNSALNVFLLSQYRKLAATNTTAQAVATEGLALAEEGQAAATAGAAAAQEGLNVAMAANPAGILLLALTAVVGAIEYFSTKTKEATDFTKEFNLEISRISDSANQIIDNIRFLTDFNNEIAKSRGAVESQITKQTIQGYLSESSAYQEAINTKTTALQDFLAKSLDIRDFNIKSQKDAENALIFTENALANPAFKKMGEEFTKSLESANESAKSIVNDFRTIGDLEHQVQLANQKMTVQMFQEALRSASAYTESRLLLAKKNTYEELQLQKYAIQARAALDLAAGNLTLGERQRILVRQNKDIEEADRAFQVLQLNNQKALIEARLANVKKGSAEELQTRIELIQKGTEIELAQAALTDEQITKIKAESARQVADITRKYNEDVLKSEINTNISVIKAKLAAVKQGSKEEFDYRSQLLDQNARLEIAQAKEQISNEDQLQARITQIFAEALAQRKELTNEFVKATLSQQFEEIDRQLSRITDPLDRIINSPRTNANEKLSAQLKRNQAEVDALREKQAKLAEQIVIGTGNVKEMIQQFDELTRAIDRVNQETDKVKSDAFSKKLLKLAGDIFEVSAALGQLSAALKDTNAGLSDTLDTMSSIGNVAGNVVSSVAKFAAGDVAGGIADGIKSIAGIFQIGAAAKASVKQAMKDIDDFYSRIKAGELELTQTYRERARDLVLINKIRLQGLKDENALLVDQKNAVQDQYNIILAQLQAQSFVANEVTKKYGGFLGIGRKTKAVEVFQSLAGKSFDELEKLFSQGQLTGKAKDLFEQLQKIKQEGADIDTLLAQNAQTFREAITGTNTDNISQSIIDGFKNGLKSARDFASTFQDLMQQALLQSLQMKYLEAPLQDFFNQFAFLADSGGQLTSGEINDLQNMYNTIIQNAADQFQQLQQIAGVNFNFGGGSGSTNSLSGVIKGITEQQADLLASQFGGLRITAIEALAVSRRQLEALNSIQANTATNSARALALLEKFSAYETGQKKIHVQI